MISDRLLALVRCPDCRGALSSDTLTCRGCGRVYQAPGREFLDMRPADQFAEQTKYLDEALHADARHERVSPPLLGSKIRNDMLRAFLRPARGDVILDLGCGSGRALVWNRDRGADMIGVDISPFFSQDARRDVPLLLGDLRRLPFADGTFTKAWSLDVLEHLSPDALRGMLSEANRALAPGGALFVYSHVRKNAPIAAGLRWINALARQLERAGLIDMRQERLRKSDHLNPLADVPDLERTARDCGFRIDRITFYTPIVGGFVENIMMRMAERAMARRAARRFAGERNGDAEARAIKEARSAAKAQIARSPATYGALRALSFAMKLDLLLFGRITSGPFFALLVKEGEPRNTPPATGSDLRGAVGER
ncbi:MAG TPA: methyltransferase domain-containing protein [Vicinamibacterales bacterium]|nr:methyltransferase domain-containing protein [Vicinamibacterales bacterium]